MVTTLLTIGGYYCIAFSIFHILFWKLFHWRQELQRLSSANRAIMQILNLRLIYVFQVFGVLSLRYQQELLFTSFGQVVTLAIALFWFTRAVEQIIFFGFKTAISIMLCIVFFVGSGLYVGALM
jgi:hypothetical protein